MSETHDDSKRPVSGTLSSQYRAIYSNAWSLSLADNDASIHFGIAAQSLGNPDNMEYREVSVMMTLRSLKILSLVLSRALAAHEEAHGPISIPSEKLAELDRIAPPHSEAES